MGQNCLTVHSCVQLSTAVSNCPQLCPTVHSCVQLSTAVSNCPQLCPTVHSCVQLSTAVSNCPQLCPTVHSCVQLSTAVSNCPQLCPTVHSCVQLSTAVSNCPQLCADLNATNCVVLIQTALDEAGIRDGLKEGGEEDECRVRVPKDRPKVYGAIPGDITLRLHVNCHFINYTALFASINLKQYFLNVFPL